MKTRKCSTARRPDKDSKVHLTVDFNKTLCRRIVRHTLGADSEVNCRRCLTVAASVKSAEREVTLGVSRGD